MVTATERVPYTVRHNSQAVYGKVDGWCKKKKRESIKDQCMLRNMETLGKKERLDRLRKRVEEAASGGTSTTGKWGGRQT